MKKVVVEYGRWWKRKISIDVPVRWDDLTASQFRICAKIINSEMTDLDFISGFFGIPKRIASRLDKFEQYRLIEMADFVSNPKGIIDHFYMEKLPGTGLLAPKRKLKGVDFEHFMLFDTFFFDYVNNPTEELLRKFVAALYLPRDRKVTDIDFDLHMTLLKISDPSTLYAVFINYTFIRKWLAKGFPYLFGFTEEEERPSRKKPAKKKASKKGPDWVGILDAMVADDVIHYEEYKKIPCTVAFRTINRRIINYNKNGRN